MSTLVTRGDGHGTALLANVATTHRRRRVDVPGVGPVTARSFDGHGRLTATVTGDGPVTVGVPAGGFAVALR